MLMRLERAKLRSLEIGKNAGLMFQCVIDCLQKNSEELDKKLHNCGAITIDDE
jgi:hypothetical protein